MLKMPMKCQIMRHAQSLANVIGAKAGKDSALSDHGKTQATQLSGYVDCIIVSCLKRAQDTIKYSNIKYKEIIVTEYCRELMHGNISDYLQNENETYIETQQQTDERIIKLKHLLKDVCDKHQSVLLVSHAMFICTLTQRKTGVYNCEILDWNFAE